jgi:hypothetical protein
LRAAFIAALIRHAWRRKPISWLEYWEGPINRSAGFKTILVYCVGPAHPATYHDACHHNGRLRLDDLPDWDWRDIKRTPLLKRWSSRRLDHAPS